MKYTIQRLFLLWFLCSAPLIFGVDIITFFIHPFPELKPVTQEKIIKNLATPGKISGKLLKTNFADQTEGILATYQGYLGLSNFNGQITFPRGKLLSNAVNILITERIDPVMMIGTTVHHWELDPSVSAELFSIKREQDPETKLYFWNTQKAELPNNKIISLNTIVIFSKPQNIYVPIGITLSDNNPQLILPNMYAKKSNSIFMEAFWVLTIKHFFSSLKRTRQKNSTTHYSEQLAL